MNSQFVAGLDTAWAIAVFGLGLFFAASYLFRRRDVEYLLFAVLCGALGVFTTGMALGYDSVGYDQWRWAANIAHAGILAAAAVNLHFVCRFTRAAQSRWGPAIVYVVTVPLIVAALSDWWWRNDSGYVVKGSVIGLETSHLVAEPSAVAIAGYVFMLLEIMASTILLVRAFTKGHRESLWVLVGGAFILVAAINDVLLVSGYWGSIYVFPMAFVAYALTVAMTFPARYQHAAGALETTTHHLARANRDLRSSHAELREVRSELDKKAQLAAVGELAAAIAHEVRNPLAVIVNACANLKRPAVPQNDRHMLLGIVEEEAERLNRLITDLVRFARPAGTRRTAVQIGPIVERALRVARAEHGVEAHFEGDGELSAVADPDLLPLVFDNLIENACQATGSGGRIDVTARAEARHGRQLVRLEISDWGHGMDDSVLAQAADPFFTTRDAGTGLGLTIVKRIVEAHGGSIDFSSEPGSGTRVLLHFPLAGPGDDVSSLSRIPVGRALADPESAGDGRAT